MFSLLSILIHIINSIFSGIYTSQFLKSKQNKKITITLWSIIYFIAQIVVFDVIDGWYSFNNMAGAIINILLFIGMQLIFYREETSRQIFVCFSFVAGKEIVKYIVNVLNFVLSTFLGS